MTDEYKIYEQTAIIAKRDARIDDLREVVEIMIKAIDEHGAGDKYLIQAMETAIEVLWS